MEIVNAKLCTKRTNTYSEFSYPAKTLLGELRNPGLFVRGFVENSRYRWGWHLLRSEYARNLGFRHPENLDFHGIRWPFRRPRYAQSPATINMRCRSALSQKRRHRTKICRRHNDYCNNSVFGKARPYDANHHFPQSLKPFFPLPLPKYSPIDTFKTFKLTN